jgi:predicted nucleic acid-binding protein
VYLDTNILLRIATNLPPEQAAATERLLRDVEAGRTASPLITASTLSEAVFVLLGKTYRYPRSAVADFIQALLDAPLRFPERAVIERALPLYRDVHDDWDDCLLSAYAIERTNGEIASFDRGLDRIPGLTRIEPAAAEAER